MNTDQPLPLYPPEAIDLDRFNQMQSPDHDNGKPIRDMTRLFHKQIILDDETIISVETIKTPGFIGIADEPFVYNTQGQLIPAHTDIVAYLNAYGFLVCTYVYHKDVYGQVIDLRWPPNPEEQSYLMEHFLKNGAHHAGVIVPAQRDGNQSFATLNEPDNYHDGMFGEPGFMAVVQGLVFPDFVTREIAKGYTDSIICWLALMNSFVEFAENDYNGSDPTKVCDRSTLAEFLKNCVLAALGDINAIDFLKKRDNQAYCSEFIYLALNTPIYPFNLPGLTRLLDGDEEKAKQILELQNQQNQGQPNPLSQRSNNPQFRQFHISMPVVSNNLPALDVLMKNNGQNIDENSIPFPPLKLSQVLRRAFQTFLPRQDVNDIAIAKAQATLLGYLEPLIIRQLGLEQQSSPRNSPARPPGISRPRPIGMMNLLSQSATNQSIQAVREFIELIQTSLTNNYPNYGELDKVMDGIMEQADKLTENSDLKYFVPPRMYTDLGEMGDKTNFPPTWGFELKTLGTLIDRSAIATNLAPEITLDIANIQGIQTEEVSRTTPPINKK